MEGTSLPLIKNEITFYMEKMFQFSFIYIGIVFATLAGANLDFMSAIASQLGSTAGLITISAILLLNLTYLTLSTACMFAILKRGYFILAHASDKSDALIRWEVFMRVRPKQFGTVGWNIDNGFLALIFVFTLGASLTLGIFGFIHSNGMTSSLLVGGLLGLHLVPMLAAWQVLKLHKACQQSI